jgi:Xaa-Pro aminopeptidase
MTDEFPTVAMTPPPIPSPSRRDDIEAKQVKVARLLEDSGSEGLLVQEPANFRWLTAGAVVRGLTGADEAPALYFSATQRWLLCSAIDTQRFFDEELDGLGFQVKEWPRGGSREQHFVDICFNRRVVSDRSFRDYKLVSAFLEQERRRLSPFESVRSRELGRLLAHALEATARNFEPGDSEEEVAGHLAHRLLKHGATPTVLQIAADERARSVRRPGFTSARVRQLCVLQATACRFGLFATASRAVAFEPLAEALKAEFDAAGQVVSAWLATIQAGHPPGALLEGMKDLLKPTAHEHEWRSAPIGWWTGRRASEGMLLGSSERFAPGHQVVWQSTVGSGVSCDTFLLDADGWAPITAVDDWPVRRFVVQQRHYDCPDLLVRASE